ncbi:4'-phosphopantetheinyl transferase [Sphaerisporangium rufum]|uniref:4'-phosphopantetheinyl transferase n=1 Tax=Sphaerisporangium rufum TaxID=1381558 RepID=A0A919UX28_9ACTN|nr:4'-phosphopantetheinyl transferase superfamily protein [Sphaerisporangium rufum]GII76601.1 4'-phosphopantetheinyl transferase [Sphaerisporangium rufum]
MIEAILPAGVVSAELFDDPVDAVLFPEEEQAVELAVDKRRREFTTARVCARRAMAALGVPAAPVVPGPRGEPRWPAGIVGSMTHCAGYRGAVLARAAEVTAIGIDAEPDQELPEGVLDVIARPEEHGLLRELRGHPAGVSWERLLFCAKEAVYKAWFPLAGRWLGFEEASLSIDPDAGAFSARLLVPGPRVAGREVTGFTGRWTAGDGLILTAIVIPAGHPAG